MNINDSASRENLLKLIACQLVVAGSARHHHRFNIQIVQGISNPMEQHAIVCNHLLGFIELAVTALGVAAAEIAWRQYGLYAHIPKHGLGS